MRCHDPGEAREDPRINLLKREVLSFFFPSFPILSRRSTRHGWIWRRGNAGSVCMDEFGLTVLVPFPPARAARDNVCVCVCAKGKLQTDTHTIRTHARRAKENTRIKNKEKHIPTEILYL